MQEDQTSKALPLGMFVGCAVVVLWFLWPFAALSLTSFAYAMFAGSALFLCAWFCASAALPSSKVRLWVQVIAVGIAAFVIGLGADFGFSFGMQDEGKSAESRFIARALDASVCALAAAVVILIDRRFPHKAV